MRSRRRELAAAALTAPWLVWAAARGLGLDRGHPVVAVLAFTPFAAATSVLPLGVALALGAWRAAALAAITALALLAAVAPRALPGPDPGSGRGGPQGPELTVMTSNVYAGRADARAVMRLVAEHDVDVLSLQELTPAAVAALDRAGARRRLPGRVLEARPGAAGSGLMARAALTPSGPRDTTGAAQPEGRLPDGTRVKAVHPRPPISGWSERDWRRELRALPSAGGRRILAGDFNATLDHRQLRAVLARGYVDAADVAGEGLTPTWPVGRRRPPITIDHLLVPDGSAVRRFSVHRVPGSDHRAVIATVVLPAG